MLLSPGRSTVIVTSFPWLGVTVTISGSAGTHLGATAHELPLAGDAFGSGLHGHLFPLRRPARTGSDEPAVARVQALGNAGVALDTRC